MPAKSETTPNIRWSITLPGPLTITFRLQNSSSNRLGEIHDRNSEQQRYRASGLNLVTAAIMLWNTVYLERATNALSIHGLTINDSLAVPVTPKMGIYQPNWLLPLAQHHQNRGWKVLAAITAGG
jgi:hypothetical protein